MKMSPKVAWGAFTLSVFLLCGGALALYQFEQDMKKEARERLEQDSRKNAQAQHELLFRAWTTNCAGKVLRGEEPQAVWCYETQKVLNAGRP
jgi:hypothetical protein